MRIDILCSDGSPLGVTSKTIWGDNYRIGVGGAELALLTMAELWQERGYQVRIFNDPKENDASPFLQAPVAAFNPNEKRDILIVFRSPNDQAIRAKGLRVWWSCDQYTAGDFRAFSTSAHKIVTISPFHAEYFKNRYGINNTYTIDLPVRVGDYALEEEKVENRVIFTSVPDRGLFLLARAWPSISRRVPDASLVITSDYRLWGAAELNERYKVMFLNAKNVSFLGAIYREQFIREQLAAECLAYPCIYDELFCIAVAESQIAKAYPITSNRGSLATTCLGTKLDFPIGREEMMIGKFADEVVGYLLQSPDQKKMQAETVYYESLLRFSPENILSIWDKEIFDL